MCARPQPDPDKSRVFKGEIETPATVLYEQNAESPFDKVYHVEINDTKFLMASKDELFPGQVIIFKGEFKKVGNFYGYVPKDIECLLDEAA